MTAPLDSAALDRADGTGTTLVQLQQGLVSPAQALAQTAQARTTAGVAGMAAGMMTSRQLFGVLFALLLGVLIVTSKFANQTAAVTSVTVPRRVTVIRARVARTLNRPADARAPSGWLPLDHADSIRRPHIAGQQPGQQVPSLLRHGRIAAGRGAAGGVDVLLRISEREWGTWITRRPGAL
jgi:hypothetical protein